MKKLISEIIYKFSNYGFISICESLFHRLVNPVKLELECIYYRLKKVNLEKICLDHIEIRSGNEYLPFFRGREWPPPFSADVRNIGELIREMGSWNKTVEKADSVVADRLEIFSSMDIELAGRGTEIDWHRQYPKAARWKQIYFKKLRKCFRNDFHNKDYIGDVLIPWEVGKQIYLFAVGRAYILTKDEKYTGTFMRHINSFISENPYGIGVHWMNGLIVAQRAISWCFSFRFFIDSEKLDEGFTRRFLGMLYLHGQYIHRNLEKGRISNNHLISNISGLYCLGILFPEFDDAKLWLKTARSLLKEEVQRQIYPDGVNFEQSSVYHRYVLELLLLVLILAKANRHEADVRLLGGSVEKMIEYLMWICLPDGTIPIIGDNHETSVFPLNNNEANNVRHLFAIGAYLFRRKDFKYAAHNEIEALLWLYGREAVDATFNALKAEAPKSNSMGFESGGYYIFKDSWDDNATTMIVDCGYIGLGKPRRYIGSHGHSDMLSFILTVRGVPFIVDSGCYTYTGSKQWHDYFRCTRGHNTIVVDGRDQCGRLLSTWKVERQPNIIGRRFGEFDNQGVFVEAAHDGYSTDLDPLIHKRRVRFIRGKACYSLSDEFNSVKRHKYESLHHFHPDVELFEGPEKKGIIAKCEGIELLIRANCFSSEQKRTIPLKFHIEDCWYSDHYGRKRESKMLNISWVSDVPCGLKTSINYS